VDAILAKGKKWNEMVTEQHLFEISEPLAAEDSLR
jgi:hypothetical protein